MPAFQGMPRNEPVTRLDQAARSDRPAGDEPEEREPEPSPRAPAPARAPRPAHVALLTVVAVALWIAASPHVSRPRGATRAFDPHVVLAFGSKDQR